ncbi:MAG: patatin-like phospholipase family protein, partial [Vulcanimicrobiaceae bacterium]
MKALVLSGGGARGAYEAGVIDGLVSKGEHFDILCGTSIGALNAAFVAQDNIDDMRMTWANIAAAKVVTLLPLVSSIESIANEAAITLSRPPLRRLFSWPSIALQILAMRKSAPQILGML